MWWMVPAALAQSVRVDASRLRPYADHYGYAMVESASTLRHLQVTAGLWGQHEESFFDAIFLPVGALGKVERRSTSHLQGGMGLSRYFSFSADLPVVLWQEGIDLASMGEATRFDLVSSGLGDIGVTPKVVLVDHDLLPVGLAISSRVTVPMGEPRGFVSANGVTANPMLVFEAADEPIHSGAYRVRGALNLGVHLRNASPWTGLSSEDRGVWKVHGSEFEYRAALAARPAPPFELGAELLGAYGWDTGYAPVEGGAYLKLLDKDFIQLTAGATIPFLAGINAPDHRFYLGASLAPNFDPTRLDRDGDGIPNRSDACINIPEDADGFEDEDGCPEPDNDRDGIADRQDHCPDDPEDRDGFQDQDGCPEPDNDADGIPDVTDGCPDVPETFNQYKDDDGCPDEKPLSDTDGDGYVDTLDRCPYDAEDFDGFQDDDGCPEADNDNDGIVDALDNCPLEREMHNGFEDEDGCPDEAPGRVVVESSRIRITERIYFEYNRAEIKPESFSLMDEIASVILQHADLKKIRVEGHTDSDGDDVYNLRLSQARAESVVNYLVAKGVQRDRLDPAGFGETRPIAPNDTEEGKQDNRRVEFLIIERD